MTPSKTAWAATLGPFVTAALACSNAGPEAGVTKYDSLVLADEPVAFWEMSNPCGAEADLTGNGHIGTYNGGSPNLVAMPDGSQVVDFNGSTEYMTVPSSTAFSIPTTHQLTWEGWIRPDVLQFTSASDTEGYNYVDWMGKCHQYSPTCEWEARMYNDSNPQYRCDRLSAYVFNPSAGLGSAADWQPAPAVGGSASSCTSSILRPGQWLYVVGEYQTLTTPAQCNSMYPGTINVWVNGVEQDFAQHEPTGCMSQYEIVPQALSSPLNIGTMTAHDTWFPGAVGKVAIYDHLLTQAQIDAHFTAMTGAHVSGSCDETCTIPVPTP
jgi:hypothetical protein